MRTPKYKTEEERNEAKRINRKKYRDANKDKVKEQIKNWHENNPDKAKKYAKNWATLNPEKRKISYKKCFNKSMTKIKIRTYRKNKFKNDPLYKLTTNIRSSISQSFKRANKNKTLKTEQILGCSFEEFKLHLENQFQPWMNWDNKGKYNGELNYGWDIDHYIPLSTAKTEENIIQLNHYSNLQPLCSKINRDIKKNKL